MYNSKYIGHYLEYIAFISQSFYGYVHVFIQQIIF